MKFVKINKNISKETLEHYGLDHRPDILGNVYELKGELVGGYYNVTIPEKEEILELLKDHNDKTLSHDFSIPKRFCEVFDDIESIRHKKYIRLLSYNDALSTIEFIENNKCYAHIIPGGIETDISNKVLSKLKDKLDKSSLRYEIGEEHPTEIHNKIKRIFK